MKTTDNAMQIASLMKIVTALTAAATPDPQAKEADVLAAHQLASKEIAEWAHEFRTTNTP